MYAYRNLCNGAYLEEWATIRQSIKQDFFIHSENKDVEGINKDYKYRNSINKL
jgi:hypothetical protein